jgi:DNA-binding NtrC family response regulator
MMAEQKGDAVQRERILVVDDEPSVCVSCTRMLTAEGYEAEYRQDPKLGLEAASTKTYDVILLDLVMPELPGLKFLQALRARGVTSEVIIITAHATIQTAVEAMKQGAADYISKPFTPDELRLAVHKVVERSALIREIDALRRELGTHEGFEGIIGDSPCMEQVFWVVRRVAPTDGTVLITGESGTGKEMVAVAIHRLSRRKHRPFLACDCSSLAPGVLESELFGHVKGSFSGAIATKQGQFAAASGGTLFLDEVGNIGLETQAKLLRVLETKRVRMVGDTAEREVDIRLIVATNRDLAEMVREGTFREDLFYRLSVVPLQLPPLRERTGDIPKLATVFLERFRKDNETPVRGFTPEAMSILESWTWPGNVRELKNLVERLAILCSAERVEPAHLPVELQQVPALAAHGPLPSSWEGFKNLKQQVRDAAVRDLERRFLLEALRKTGGNVSNAALAVGMQRTRFHALMRKHEITTDDL